MTGKVGKGSIVLFHNAGEHTPEALPDILKYLKQEGYEVVPVSQILLNGEYTINHEGRQCSAQKPPADAGGFSAVAGRFLPVLLA